MVKNCALFLMAALAILQVSGADDAKEYLDAHNEARAALGVEPLKWSEKLASASRELVLHQRDVMGCHYTKSTEYGVNQIRDWGTTIPPRTVVDGWVKEKTYYKHADNSCVPDHECGSYTQVVWKKSLELGCAQATCANNRTSLTICFYNPPGNIKGESPY
ncbi:hypothetical protein L6164_027762 [Bauhinia variegata]|uniref:Uncharacterized protein n=1 Tax=Bauhinia variegata TaxID=167791 RepID=A0ACB9LVJ2_BAUVA|nr:hypothetical protein L6164_027762 [Bauhinia variegata]